MLPCAPVQDETRTCFKPSNALLNVEMTGHVADLGIENSLPEALTTVLQNQSSSIRIRGIIGYVVLLLITFLASSKSVLLLIYEVKPSDCNLWSCI